jgi:hypothetical protein
MADALQDLSTAASAVSGMIGSISSLMTTRINAEAALKASEIAAAQAAFKKRFTLPFGDKNKITTQNYRTELESFDASIRDSIGAIENKQVRGAVDQRFAAINSQFSLDVSNEQYGLYVQETQYDRFKTYNNIKNSDISEDQKLIQLEALMAEDKALGIWKPQDFDKNYAAFVTDTAANMAAQGLSSTYGTYREALGHLDEVKNPDTRSATQEKIRAAMKAEDDRMFDKDSGELKVLEEKLAAGTLTVDEIENTMNNFNGSQDAADTLAAFADKAAGGLISDDLYKWFTDNVVSKVNKNELNPDQARAYKKILHNLGTDMTADEYSKSSEMLGTLLRQLDGYIDESVKLSPEQQAQFEESKIYLDWSSKKGKGDVKSITDAWTKAVAVGLKYKSSSVLNRVREMINAPGVTESERMIGTSLINSVGDEMIAGAIRSSLADPTREGAKKLIDVLGKHGLKFMNKNGTVDLDTLKKGLMADTILQQAMSSVNSRITHEGTTNQTEIDKMLGDAIVAGAMYKNFLEPVKSGASGPVSKLSEAYRYLIDQGHILDMSEVELSGEIVQPMEVRTRLVDALRPSFKDGLSELGIDIESGGFKVDPLTLDMSFKAKDGTVYSFDTDEKIDKMYINATKDGKTNKVFELDDNGLRKAWGAISGAVSSGTTAVGKAVVDAAKGMANDVAENSKKNEAAAKAAEDANRETQSEWDTLMRDAPPNYDKKLWEKKSPSAREATLKAMGFIKPKE